MMYKLPEIKKNVSIKVAFEIRKALHVKKEKNGKSITFMANEAIKQYLKGGTK